MGYQWGLALHFIIVTIILVATTTSCLGARNRNSTVACFEHERLALLEFKDGVTIGDSSYDMLSSWVGNDCCHWERVTCNGVTGNIESLHLRADFATFYREYLVVEELSTSLQKLRHLKYLDLSGNYFQENQIPEFIGSLNQLTYLNLSNSYFSFSAIIPYHIGNLSHLKILDLRSTNLMSHDITWISSLSSLEYLDLSYVNLTRAKILDVGFYMALSLKVLKLSNCGLLIDDRGLLRNLSTTLSNIKHLDLSRNIFTDKIPCFFQNLTSLQFLDLSYPDGGALNFSSSFLKLLSMSPSLLELHLSYCNLKETPLSLVLHNLTTLSNIQTLDLSSNELTGSIPESVSPIPESIGRLAALTDLSLMENKLSGTIPVSIGQLSKLRYLIVDHNSLEGVVYESHFANLSMLEYLYAAYNTKLTFNVSREWLPPFQLIRIDLSSCKIENGFPHWLQNQRKLQILDLSNATISGPLPTWLQKMPINSYIDLSHNNLSGPLTNLPSGESGIYSYLFLKNNLFNESIPRSLCKWTRLRNNSFTREIPRSLCKSLKLQVLDVAHNNFTGTIPHCLGELQGMVEKPTYNAYDWSSYEGLIEA
ncbi:hypothetical protein M8C21_008164, partial [Ambrosia artemisiifolia]